MNQEGKYTGLYYFNDAVNTIGTLLTINNDANDSANKIITQIKIILDGKKIAIRFYRGVSAWQPWYYLAPLDSPAITGKPTSPTAPIDTNNTQIATCEFVKAQSASMQIDTLDLNYQNNIYWSKEPSVVITQFIELTADTEEISISLPISFSQKCLFVGIEIDNKDKDISKNVSFNVIEKGLDSIKLFKIGEGTPNITVMVKGI